MRPESTGIPHGCQALVYGVNICSTDRETVSGSFTYRLREEEEAVARYCSRPGRYLYEPYRHLLKCGAFKLLSQRYNLLKLAPATHLYTSDEPCNGFPGKIFAITEVCDFSKQTMKAMAKRFPVINLTARNFPLGSDAMKKSYGIKDGGDRHLFVTTLTDSRKTIILTQIPTNGD